jgi:stress-induced morphogen
MSEGNLIKIEPFDNEFDEVKSIECIENNIKKEPEVEFVLILPPRHVKVEKFEEEKVQQNKAQNEEKKFQCQQCPKLFDNQKNLIQHETIHEPKTKCQICSKEISKCHLTYHLKRHENIRKFNCDHCGAGYVTKCHLVQHMWKHRSDKQFNCTQCTRGFNDSGNFTIHLLSHSSNPRPFQCDLCPKSYSSKQRIKVHLDATHTEQSFKCNKCDFTTKRKPNLNIHKRRRHSSAKPFSCQICEKKFKTKRYVKQHQIVHKTKTKGFSGPWFFISQFYQFSNEKREH